MNELLKLKAIFKIAKSTYEGVYSTIHNEKKVVDKTATLKLAKKEILEIYPNIDFDLDFIKIAGSILSDSELSIWMEYGTSMLSPDKVLALELEEKKYKLITFLTSDNVKIGSYNIKI
jgi:hypothetical protein